jgi:hypothetical protein
VKGETVTVVSPSAAAVPPTYDEAGAPVLAAPTTFTFTTLAPCAPILSDESEEAAGARVITGYRIFGPSGLALSPADRLTIRGVPGWQVEGELGQWNRGSNGTGKGVEFMVRRGS